MLILKDFQENIAIHFATDTFKQKSSRLIETIKEGKCMNEELSREGGCLCGNCRYRTIGDSPRAILCHCRYCQTLTGSALSTNVWFPEEKVSLLKGDLSSYEMKTESGNLVTTNFCKNCGSTVFLRLNVFKGMVAIPGGCYDPPTFWFEPQVENFCRSKVPFIETEIPEKNNTHPMYKPVREDMHPHKNST